MERNLLKPEWAALEPDELRVLLENRIGGPGQITGEQSDSCFYLPLAGPNCQVALRFVGASISKVEPGPAFDAEQWARLSSDIDTLLHTAPSKVGRNIAFSGFRVTGWWRGEQSAAQILPPPAGAPTVPYEMGEHPFILEFPLHADSAFTVTNFRRLREHRNLARLLNVLLTGGVRCETGQPEHVWAINVNAIGSEPHPRSAWLQRSYFGADFGQIITDSLSTPIGESMEVVAPEQYYARVGHDGRPLNVPSDLDESICRYRALSHEYRDRFNRALFWLDIASRHWASSMSSSFAALVTAIEALTARGTAHKLYCPECDDVRTHEMPGPTALFRNFFETYAPGASQKQRRTEMYDLRSSISHGSALIAFDEGRAIGWDPPWSRQRDLHWELWSITRIAMRNYLSNPAGATSADPK